jgi:hypothetical protein
MRRGDDRRANTPTCAHTHVHTRARAHTHTHTHTHSTTQLVDSAQDFLQPEIIAGLDLGFSLPASFTAWVQVPCLAHPSVPVPRAPESFIAAVFSIPVFLRACV